MSIIVIDQSLCCPDFERIIYDQLYAYLDNNSILSKQLYGFRTKHSTELA